MGDCAHHVPGVDLDHRRQALLTGTRFAVDERIETERPEVAGAGDCSRREQRRSIGLRERIQRVELLEHSLQRSDISLLDICIHQGGQAFTICGRIPGDGSGQ